MRVFLSLPFLLIALMACNQTNKMTEKEIKLINSSDASTPFRVLLTTDKEDSLFLRQKAVDVDVEGIADNKDLQLLIKRMKVTLEEQEGVGLAAPQVGIGRNIFLFIRIGEPDYPVQVVINPTIINKPNETICFFGDGCLSVPEESGNTERYPWVEVAYYDETGKLIKETLKGGSRKEDFSGVIFQHEFDHLNGILFTDRLVPDDLFEEEEEDLD